MDFSQWIRDVPDFPKPGILFKDITPLLAHPPALEGAMKAMMAPFIDLEPTRIVGIESRGFLFGTTMAIHLGVPFVPARKKGKLPWKTKEKSYALEYGEATLELHVDAIEQNDRVLVVDDLLATGGTAAAVGALVEELGGQVVGYSFLIELAFLGGASKLAPAKVQSVLCYD